MTDLAAAATALVERVVAEYFAAHPATARAAGDHRFDGVVADLGAAAVASRVRRLHETAAELDAVETAGLDAEARADVDTAGRLVADELFHLEVLRSPWSDPQMALRSADVFSYVSRPYAPVAERAEALCRHLEAVPEALGVAAEMLDDELPMGPRSVSIDEAHGHVAFYRNEVMREVGDLGDARLRRRLEAAVDAAAVACAAFADAVEGRGQRADSALGEERFCAMLTAQEGVVETAAALRRRVDVEMERLQAEAEEVAGRAGGGSVADAFGRMEADHADAAHLLDTARETLDRLRDFWNSTGCVSIDDDIRCTVRETPAFFSWVTAAFENPGPLDPPGMPHYYFVTPVDPAWSNDKAEEWLSHLNRSSMENISVHEVYPGHFVHAVNGLRSPSLMRRVVWFGAFAEGWAHYTEQLAVEHGLAEGRPLLHLAQVQDALLRVCRFSATVGMHTEGMSLEEATRLFEEQAHIPRLAAEREAMRGTHDPMYLVYSYGKMEILRWREELRGRPGFSERAFHDRMLASGFPPLAVVRDYLWAGFPA